MQGAPFFSFPSLIRSCAVVLSLFAGTAWAEIGTVQFALGDVRIIGPNGVSRAGVKGALINEGDSVTVGPAASAQLKMVDGGLLAIRPDTQMKFDEYKFSGREDGTERSVMSLLRGGFRSITGAIGRINKNNYRVNTPTATIGIRGTDKEVIVVLPPLPGVALAAAAAAPGTYAKVNVGAAFIRTQVSTVNIAPNQVGFAGGQPISAVAAPGSRLIPCSAAADSRAGARRGTTTGAAGRTAGRSTGSTAGPVHRTGRRSGTAECRRACTGASGPLAFFLLGGQQQFGRCCIFHRRAIREYLAYHHDHGGDDNADRRRGYHHYVDHHDRSGAGDIDRHIGPGSEPEYPDNYNQHRHLGAHRSGRCCRPGRSCGSSSSCCRHGVE